MKTGAMGSRKASGKAEGRSTTGSSMMSMTGKKSKATSAKHEQKICRA